MEISIQNNDKLYIPIVEEGVTLKTDRAGSPGELKFKVVKDPVISFAEGDIVRMKVGETGVFYGFVFTKQRNKDGTINVTAYDQTRYLKNKYSYVYTGKTASEFIKMVASDFKLQVGDLEDTKYIIPSRVESNTPLIDMIQTALDLTLQNKNEMYTFYDDYGKLTLKNIKNMQVNIIIDDETGEDFNYTSSIDKNTYNKIIIFDKNNKENRFVVAKDDKNIENWGILQCFEELQSGENARIKADTLLKLYNKKTRNLSVNGVFGDIRVRAGCTVPVFLNLGDIITGNMMMIEKCTHTFKNNEHTMNLTLRGGEFIA